MGGARGRRRSHRGCRNRGRGRGAGSPPPECSPSLEEEEMDYFNYKFFKFVILINEDPFSSKRLPEKLMVKVFDDTSYHRHYHNDSGDDRTMTRSL
jgi:hypothetical protein